MLIFSTVPVQYLGTFATSEIPPPIVHQFVDSFGEPVPLTGFSTTAYIESVPENTAAGTGSIMIVDEAEGIVQYTWGVDDMSDPGSYRLQMWATNAGPTRNHASDIFSYEVYDGVGPV